ncbi:hypothetical protein Tco_0728375 [Tanacetum coccineum]|uniref:Transposase n=1 Tax=Tanacetum coccineum TaxID=301880 RepID=A0ABQ4YKZ6_9ASTR
MEEYSIVWEIKERVCPHTRKAVTRVIAQKEQNPSPENVTMKEHVYRGRKCSLKVKIAKGDTESQNQIAKREEESTKDSVQRFKAKSRHVKGAPDCMRISGFMHGITNYELIKRLHDNILKSVDEMIRVTTTFLRGEVASSNQAKMKTLPAWKQQESRKKVKFLQKGRFLESAKIRAET